jgi:hypothetical protein
MSSGGGGSTQTIQKADPWIGAQPYLHDIMGQAQNAYSRSQGNTYYPGSTVVPFSPETQAGLGAITARATQGSPLTAAAQNQNLASMRGDYLDPTQNPAYGGLMQDVRNQVNSQFGAAGRTGSGAHTGALTREMMDSAGRLYQQERTNQLNATQLAPTLAGQDYVDAQALLGVGAQREGLGQQYVGDQMARWDYAQQQPWQNLQNYSGLVSGMGGMGGTSSTTQPGGGYNPIGGAMGGALAGGSLFGAGGPLAGAMGITGPWGAGIGAGLGLLGGLFG